MKKAKRFEKPNEVERAIFSEKPRGYERAIEIKKTISCKRSQEDGE